MVIFTERFDTPDKIANRYLGFNDEDFVRKLLKANAQSKAGMEFARCNIYPKDHAFWVPEQCQFIDEQTQNFILERFDSMAPYELEKLATAQQRGYDINELLTVHEANNFLVDVANSAEGLSSYLSYMNTWNGVMYNGFEDFSKKIKQLANLDKQYNTASFAKKIAIDLDRKQLVDALNQEYPFFLKNYKDVKLPALNSAIVPSSAIANKGWSIYYALDADKIANFAKFLKFVEWLEYGLIIISVGTNAIATWNSTHDLDLVGEVLLKDMVKVLVDIVTGLSLNIVAIQLLKNPMVLRTLVSAGVVAVVFILNQIIG